MENGPMELPRMNTQGLVNKEQGSVRECTEILKLRGS
jgi:hypothetical protein